MLPWSSLHEGFLWPKLEEFVQAFVEKQRGSVDIFNFNTPFRARVLAK
jgi:hypothetical protein